MTNAHHGTIEALSHNTTIEFAEKVFAILNEGAKTATYKYAVLMAMVDYCSEQIDLHGHPPAAITTRQLAHKVIELYWHHSMPFGSSGEPLRQCNRLGKQAEVISDIVRVRRSYPESDSPFQFKRNHETAFEKFLEKIEHKLAEDPLPRLQVIRGLTDPFIYAIGWKAGIARTEFREVNNNIYFIDDAALHLVRLRGLLRPMLEQEWARWIRDQNRIENEIDSYLFPDSRVPTARLRQPLTELQNNCCFYCNKSLTGRSESAIDHFLPWARTHSDDLANLVLAHTSCNASKSAYYAAAEHLQHWVNRLDMHRQTLGQISNHINWPLNESVALGLARGIYLYLPAGIRLWKSGTEFADFKRHEIAGALGVEG